jgi:hypothetical protein
MTTAYFRKGLVFAVIILFIGASIFSYVYFWLSENISLFKIRTKDFYQSSLIISISLYEISDKYIHS